VRNWSLTEELLSRCISKTNCFFLKQYTNCSLFTVVSVMGLLRYYHTGSTSSEILECFLNQSISTRQFLLDHQGKRSSGHKTQLALFLFGMTYADYSRPDHVHFDRPGKIIRDVSSSYMEVIQARQAMVLNKSVKVQRRLLKRLEAADPFRRYHDHPPTLFSHEEVDELNRSRDENDRLELTESGLLRHHCCYPRCLMYLKDLRSDGVPQRYTLMHHLQFDDLLHNRVQGFHKNARYLLRRARDWEDFVRSMDALYATHRDYSQTINLKDTLLTLWRKYKHLPTAPT